MGWSESGTGTVAAANAKASSTTFTTGAVSAAAGETVLLAVCFDNATTGPTISSISKPGGETANWVKLSIHDHGSALAGAAVNGELWGITLTQAWSAFQPVVTISSAVTAKASAGKVMAGGTLTGRGTLPVAGAFATNGTASKTLTGTNQPQNGDLVVGVGTKESATPPTADADTTNGTWSAGVTSNSSGSTDASNVSLRLQWKIVTATGDQTFNPGLAGDSGVAAVALAPAPVTGTLATTLAGSTLAGSGAETMAGTLAATLVGATLAATGAETIQGTLAATLAAATLAAAGTVEDSGVTGTLATTLPGANLTATGAEQMAGPLATTLAGAALAAAGFEQIPGTLAATLASSTLTGTGNVTPPAVTGTLATTLADATLAATSTPPPEPPPPASWASAHYLIPGF